MLSSINIKIQNGAEMRKKMGSDIKQFCKMLEKSVSPFHAVEEAAAQLDKAGFTELSLDKTWSIIKGGKYYLRIYGSTLIGFTVGEQRQTGDMLRIEAAHTDWPCLKLKSLPEKAGRYAVLNVEVYGGPILNTWLDRPLSIAGRVALRSKKVFEPEIRFVDFKRPVCVIPNLAIHMNRKVNEGVELNRQIDLLPLCGTKKDGNWFIKELAKELSVEGKDILDYELNLYVMDKPVITGFDKSMITSPRIDNISSVHACISGLIGGTRTDGINLIALFDNEEVGSKTKQGGDSMLLAYVIEKLYLSLGETREDYLNGLAGGMMLSVDVAHALHPNRPEKCDITNQICLNEGVAIKQSGTQRYATDCWAAAVIEQICKKNKIEYKRFVNRSDILGGATIGSLLSSQLVIRTVDMGVPILAMHSAVETMGAKDQESLCNLMRMFFA